LACLGGSSCAYRTFPDACCVCGSVAMAFTPRQG
jgi:hypothetical protein